MGIKTGGAVSVSDGVLDPIGLVFVRHGGLVETENVPYICLLVCPTLVRIFTTSSRKPMVDDLRIPGANLSFTGLDRERERAQAQFESIRFPHFLDSHSLVKQAVAQRK